MEKQVINYRVKEALKEHNVKRWELADALGHSEMYVYRALRHELPKEEQERYVQLIKGVAERRTA